MNIHHILVDQLVYIFRSIRYILHIQKVLCMYMLYACALRTRSHILVGGSGKERKKRKSTRKREREINAHVLWSSKSCGVCQDYEPEFSYLHRILYILLEPCAISFSLSRFYFLSFTSSFPLFPSFSSSLSLSLSRFFSLPLPFFAQSTLLHLPRHRTVIPHYTLDNENEQLV